MTHTPSFAIEIARDRKATPAGTNRALPAGGVAPGTPFAARMHGHDEPPGLAFAPLCESRRMVHVEGSGDRDSGAQDARFADDPDFALAAHEAGHCIGARLLDAPIHLVTIVRNEKLGYAGRVVHEGSPLNRSLAEDDAYADKLAAVIHNSSVQVNGDGFIDPWRPAVYSGCLEMLAGAAAEIIIVGRFDDIGAESNFRYARLLARAIWSGDASTEAFLKFVLEEAIALLRPHRSVLLALTAELIGKRTLTGAEVDEAIASAIAAKSIAVEHQRRADWLDVTRRAAAFPGDPAQ